MNPIDPVEHPMSTSDTDNARERAFIERLMAALARQPLR
jgi:hypothetical protein